MPTMACSDSCSMVVMNRAQRVWRHQAAHKARIPANPSQNGHCCECINGSISAQMTRKAAGSPMKVAIPRGQRNPCKPTLKKRLKAKESHTGWKPPSCGSLPVALAAIGSAGFGANPPFLAEGTGR